MTAGKLRQEFQLVVAQLEARKETVLSLLFPVLCTVPDPAHETMPPTLSFTLVETIQDRCSPGKLGLDNLAETLG